MKYIFNHKGIDYVGVFISSAQDVFVESVGGLSFCQHGGPVKLPYIRFVKKEDVDNGIFCVPYQIVVPACGHIYGHYDIDVLNKEWESCLWYLDRNATQLMSHITWVPHFAFDNDGAFDLANSIIDEKTERYNREKEMSMISVGDAVALIGIGPKDHDQYTVTYHPPKKKRLTK